MHYTGKHCWRYRCSWPSWISEKVKTDESGRYRVRNTVGTSGLMLIDAPGMAFTAQEFTLKEGELTLDQALEPDTAADRQGHQHGRQASRGCRRLPVEQNIFFGPVPASCQNAKI